MSCRKCFHYKLCKSLGNNTSKICEFYDFENYGTKMVKHLVKQYQEEHKNDDCNIVYCTDCKYLDIEDFGMYATCAKAYKGIVQPWDSCGKGKRKNKR